MIDSHIFSTTEAKSNLPKVIHTHVPKTVMKLRLVLGTYWMQHFSGRKWQFIRKVVWWLLDLLAKRNLSGSWYCLPEANTHTHTIEIPNAPRPKFHIAVICQPHPSRILKNDPTLWSPQCWRLRSVSTHVRECRMPWSRIAKTHYRELQMIASAFCWRWWDSIRWSG